MDGAPGLSQAARVNAFTLFQVAPNLLGILAAKRFHPVAPRA